MYVCIYVCAVHMHVYTYVSQQIKNFTYEKAIDMSENESHFRPYVPPYIATYIHIYINTLEHIYMYLCTYIFVISVILLNDWHT